MSHAVFFLFLFQISVPNGLQAQDKDFDFSFDQNQGNTDKNRGKEEKTEGSVLTSFPLRGTLSLDFARQIGDPRWVRLGPFLNLIYNQTGYLGQLYGEVSGRYNGSYRLEEDSQDTIHKYEWEAILRELYWKRNFGPITISAGKIITVWGKADIVPLVDVVSAMDMTESFFAKPEEARLGQNSIKLEYFGSKQELSFLFNPWPVANRITELDHPYALLPGQNIEKRSTEFDYELGGRYNRSFAGGSLALMAAWIQNRTPLFNFAADDSGNLSFKQQFSNYAFLGTSFNIAFDPVLLKVEAAYSFDKPYQQILFVPDCTNEGTCVEVELPNGFAKEDEVAFMLGFDLNMGSWGMLIVEGNLSRRLDVGENAAYSQNIFLSGLAWSNTFLRDDLTVSTFAYFIESWKNLVGRVQLEYKWNDYLSSMIQYTAVIIEYNREDYGYYADLDRFDISMSWHF